MDLSHSPLALAFQPRGIWASLRDTIIGLSVALAIVPIGTEALARANTPSLTPMPGKPVLMLGNYDLAPLGYQVDEYSLSGTATSYRLPGPATSDGKWNAEPDATAPYVTRMVVIRPSDPARFNGTVLVEWLNVTAGQDTPADWMLAHREILRKGYAYVAVSAQKVGVEGGDAVMSQGVPLKKADAARYQKLTHPGDAFAFDIYSQAGSALLQSKANPLGPLKPKHVLAMGESQSAAFLTTYVNAVDPLAKVYDGFFVHSRFGNCAALDGTRMRGGPTSVPDHVAFRADLRVPVLAFITETDLLGARLPGYFGARRPDGDHLRVWEVAGTAHADNYLFMGAFIDSVSLPMEQLAKVFRPITKSAAGEAAMPFNLGMPHHYGVEAALDALDSWVRSGEPPASTPLLEVGVERQPGVPPSIARDAQGIAVGGVRTPWVDVPTARLTGQGDPQSFVGMLAGSGEPFDAATLAKLYPGGKEEYLRRFTAALDQAIAAGHILPADRKEILDVAAINFDPAP